jgi:hypothetical protein
VKIVNAAGKDSTLRLLLAVGLLLVPLCALLGRFSPVLLYVAVAAVAILGLAFAVLVCRVWLRMSPSQRRGWASLKRARKRFRAWARSEGIPVERVEHVATFEDWDTSSAVVIFFKTDSDLQRLKAEGRLEAIESRYRQCLADARYPSERFPVLLEFDSHENVVKNYQGSYFCRMR